MMTGATMGKSSKQLCNIYIFYIPHNILMFLIFVSLKKKREKHIHQAYMRTLNKGKFIRYQLFFCYLLAPSQRVKQSSGP